MEQTDRQLLERFVAQADEEAFAQLVHRHGPMVLGVCRHILRREDDAEDVFQATFLVLSRKAGSIRAAEALPNWLYGVARRLATRSKFAIVRRQAREVAFVEPKAPAPDPAFEDLAPVLHEEIGRLPDKYRMPFVLCYLDGKTNEEAARELGCPSGTVFSRLSRARERLRDRLRRRGLVLTPALLLATLATLTQQASGVVPQRLSNATVRRAMRFGTRRAATDIPEETRELAEWGVSSLPRPGLIVAMAAGVLLALLFFGGIGLFLWLHGNGGERPMAERLQGGWDMKAMFIEGNPAPPQFLQAKLTFKGDQMTLSAGGGKFQIDESQRPVRIDWVLPMGISRGILDLQDNTLKIAVSTQGGAIPDDFTPQPGRSIMIFERAAP
jgi:RNA polymerase sigma factor (sigma-70 family)